MTQFPNNLQFFLFPPLSPNRVCFMVCKPTQSVPIQTRIPLLLCLLPSATGDSHGRLRSCYVVPFWGWGLQSNVATTNNSNLLSGVTYQWINNMSSWAFNPLVLTIVHSRKLTQLCGIHFLTSFPLLINLKLAMLNKDSGIVARNVVTWNE